jgi:hypothetical protein
LHRACQPELGATTVYPTMQSQKPPSRETSNVASESASWHPHRLLSFAITYDARQPSTAVLCNSESMRSQPFSRGKITSGKFLDSSELYVRTWGTWLHPIRAETLFTKSACLRRQIFIPYAPISRSLGCGANRPKNCRRRRAKLKETSNVSTSVAKVQDRPLGEFGAQSDRRNRDAMSGLGSRIGRVRDFLRNLDRQVVGVESIRSSNQYNLIS